MGIVPYDDNKNNRTTRPEHSARCSKTDASACCDNCYQLFHSQPHEHQPKSESASHPPGTRWSGPAPTPSPQLPPHNANAERALLAAALTNPTAVEGILAFVQQSDFHSYGHAIIFGRIAALHSEGITPDIYTVGTKLGGPDLADAGGTTYLAELPDAASAVRDWRHFADLIKDCAKRRAIISVARAACEAAYDPAADVSKVISDIANRANSEPKDHTIKSWWKPLTTAELIATTRKPSWLVKRLLVEGQPAIIGAPRKCLKTSIAIDLGISLASRTSFLGSFDVYHQKRVAIVSGESGNWTILETAKRIAAARGIDLPANMVWNFVLPSLSNPNDLATLRKAIKDSGIEVLILDPLYLCMLSGDDADASLAGNIYKMGPLLMAIAQACLPECTPILLHHTRKNLLKPFTPLELEDLAFSGIQEFARQWVLLNRMAPYEPGTGRHELWLSGGGSCGQSGLWALGIEEGELGDDFSGRKWEVTVASAQEAIEQRQDAMADKRDDKRSQNAKNNEAKLLNALDKADPKRQGVGFTKLRHLTGMGGDAYSGAAERLIAEGIIEAIADFTIESGKGARKPAKGIRRKNLTGEVFEPIS